MYHALKLLDCDPFSYLTWFQFVIYTHVLILSQVHTLPARGRRQYISRPRPRLRPRPHIEEYGEFQINAFDFGRGQSMNQA